MAGGGGGARIPPPPQDLGRGATKNSEIWHVSRYERADEIAILKIKAFLIMQIYVNYLYACFLFFIITDKMSFWNFQTVLILS